MPQTAPQTATASDSATDILVTLPVARERAAVAPSSPMATLLGWVESYLMAGHADLGRTGAVCPFTRQAAKLDTARLAICEAGPRDEDAAFALIRGSFRALEAIPAKPSMAHFRTVIVGFPHCASPDGIAMLKRVQDRHKFYSLARNRMIGLMYAESDAPGLWNPDFRPLRAPLPVLAIRHMVEHDAPFAARHPLLLLPYLARFPMVGAKRLFAHFRTGATA
jgi:hypothetical protein